jgi:hypothetical protein
LGDPIEIGALNAVFDTPGPEICTVILGASKSVIGHGEPASGISSLIHAFVTLRREFAPAILHLGKLNRHILTIQKSRPVELAKLASRRQSSTVETSCLASISAFAFQGTNAHAVLQDDKTNVKFDYEKPSLQVWNAEKRAFHVPAHPMLLQVSSQDDVTQRFWARFNATASQSYLFDHQINGRALAPAAGMLELASASVRSNSPSCPLILYTLGIFSPLILEMDETNTVVTCDLDICAASFQIGSNCRIGSNARGSCGPYSICNGSRNSAKLPDLSPEAVIGRLESAANWGSVFGGENDATWTPPPALDAAFQLDFTRRNKLRSGYLPTDTFVPVAVNVYVSPINFSRLAGDFVTAAPSHHRKGELTTTCFLKKAMQMSCVHYSAYSYAGLQGQNLNLQHELLASRRLKGQFCRFMRRNFFQQQSEPALTLMITVN